MAWPAAIGFLGLRASTLSGRGESDDLSTQAAAKFRAMVESVGVKRFAADMNLSTRQVNRMLSGAQPNPVERIIRCLQCCDAEVGDEALAFICQETGGHFVKEIGGFDRGSAEAVRRGAEAVAACADGYAGQINDDEIRQAISALVSLLGAEQRQPSRSREESPPVVHTRPASATTPTPTTTT